MKDEKQVSSLEKIPGFSSAESYIDIYNTRDPQLPPNFNSNPIGTPDKPSSSRGISLQNYSLRSEHSDYIFPIRSMLTKFKTLDISELSILLPDIPRDKIEKVVNSHEIGCHIKKDPNMENVYHYSRDSTFSLGLLSTQKLLCKPKFRKL